MPSAEATASPEPYQSKNLHPFTLLPDPKVGQTKTISTTKAAPTRADTLPGGVEIPTLVVGSTRSRSSEPSRVSLEEVVLGPKDAQSVADLGLLLPATQVNVNSRGESLFMIRGAPERHVRLFMDGIPLNVPWDERVDLSMVPAHAIERVEASRGIGSVLDGPNALAGVVNLLPPDLTSSHRQSHLSLRLGDGDFAEGRFLHQHRLGDWQLLGALSRRTRSGFLVPRNLMAPFHQESRLRTNSDFEQTSLLVRLDRGIGDTGRLRLLLAGSDGSKGVPPETHLETEARFWSYPRQQRGLVGFSFDLPLDSEGGWDLEVSFSGDYHHQEIRKYDDANYDSPPLVPGTEYEDGRDRTGYGHLQTRRRLSEAASVTLKAVGRYTQRRETLLIDGPEFSYSQFITALLAEASFQVGEGWNLRGGAGYEYASTPETGDKPARDPTDAPVWHLQLTRLLGHGASLHASAARRSRFPSLRELYSGSLGRFVPNPVLAPERQNQFEVGGVLRGDKWDLGLAGFASLLEGGIEKVVWPGGEGQFQRVNVENIHTLGWEFIASVRPWQGVSVSGHHTVLNTRRKMAGGSEGPAEDRPNFITHLTVSWTQASGLQLLLEMALIGARHSADLTDDADGLRRLPAQGQWNVRAGYTLYELLGGLSRVGVFVRVNNVFDQQIDAQVGLPIAGRMFYTGINAWWGDS